MISIKGEYVFHVHSWRCCHADEIRDEEYVKRAMELGAEAIYFTDHTPFPGNPFRNRMKYEQLTEYILTLKDLREKYKEKIDIKIGLEVEYLPSFKAFYEELKANEDLDLLILGQHHSEMSPGQYSFQSDTREDEWKYLMEGQMAGVSSGFFDVVAHPDRVFKREKEWSDDMEQEAKKFIDLAVNNKSWLEKNYSSIRHKGKYKKEFWMLVPDDALIIAGCDAHSLDEVMTGSGILNESERFGK